MASVDGAGRLLGRIRDEALDSLGGALDAFRNDERDLVGVAADLVVEALVALLLLAAFRVAYALVRRGVELAFRRLRLPADARGPVIAALRYVVLLLAVLAVLVQFGAPAAVLSGVGSAAVFAFLFYAGWLVGSRVLNSTMRRYALDASLQQLLRNLLGVAFGVVGFVVVLDQFGVDIIAAVTALGVVGLAFGFAAQDTLSNFISGVTLLVERPFRIGDWVELDGDVGRVQEISLRTTRVVDRDNVVHIVPNASVAKGRISNLSGGGPLRLRIPVGIAYKESARAARAVLLPVLEGHPDVLQSPPRAPAVRVEELGASSVDLVLYPWIAPDAIASAPRVRAEILEACKEALDAAGIEIPFPHLQLFVEEAKGFERLLGSLPPPGGRDDGRMP